MNRASDNDCTSSGILYPNIIDLTTLANTFLHVKNEQCYSTYVLDATKIGYNTQSDASERFGDAFSQENPTIASDCQDYSMTELLNTTSWPLDKPGRPLNATTVSTPLSPVTTQQPLQHELPKENLDGKIKREVTCSPKEVEMCHVCGDLAAGFHCGAFVCEACKKFFIRTIKQTKIHYMCMKQERCNVNKETRTQCQYCRYQKCLRLGMYKPGNGPMVDSKMSSIPCRVCGGHSSGYHFGAITCEGCKGFFRRMVREHELPKSSCSKGGNCEITLPTRNLCKICRYWKCIRVGMSPTGSRIGRQPNSVKHATMLELKGLMFEPPTLLSADIVGPLGEGHLPTELNINSRHTSTPTHELLIPKQEPCDHSFDCQSLCGEYEHSDRVCSSPASLGNTGGELEMRHWPVKGTSFPLASEPAPPHTPSVHQTKQLYNMDSPQSPDVMYSPHWPCVQETPNIIGSEECIKDGYQHEMNVDKYSILKRNAVADDMLKTNPTKKMCVNSADSFLANDDETKNIYSEPKSIVFYKYINPPIIRGSSKSAPNLADLTSSVGLCGEQSPGCSHDRNSIVDVALDMQGRTSSNGSISPECVIDDGAIEKLSSLDILDSLQACGKELKMLLQKTSNSAVVDTDDEMQIWNKIMNVFFHFCSIIIMFAKKIPFFRKLPMETQVFLIRSNIYSIVVVNMSRVYKWESKSINFFNFTAVEVNFILKHMPVMNYLCDHLRVVGDTLARLEFDDAEFTFLSILSLLSADGDLLLSRNSPSKLLEKITIALEDYEINMKGDNGMRFGQVMLRIAELRMINLQHFQIMSQFIRESSFLDIPELFSEMFGDKKACNGKC